MKIGIYGGTFDPPHLGHMEAAKAAIEHFDLDKLLLIPNKLAPHKYVPTKGAKAQDRMEMTRLMADALGPKVEVSELELLRDGLSYSIDTIKTIRAEEKKATFYLLMGTDMFFSFETWKEPKEIAKEVILAPFSREEHGSHELFAVQKEKLERELSATVETLPLPKVKPMSSTHIRKLLDEGNYNEGGALLWGAVYGYILQNELYGTKLDLKHLDLPQLRAVSYSMMRAKRIPHVMGVEETAAKLAHHWGVDELDARRAAILHDCTKYWTKEEHLDSLEQYDVPVDDLEREVEKMLHSKSGAALAEHVFGENEKVFKAIACHTTGKKDMTTLDKIIYMADYMEPNRDFDGVELLRELSFTDLNKAMVAGLSMTVEELKGKNAVVHENTRAALADFES